MKAMGTQYIDAGQVRVVSVQSKVSIAQVIFSCDYMQRGDVVLPYQERPVPPLKEAAAFDHFAPVSGKPVAMVVTGKDHQDTFGKNSAVYVNLGRSEEHTSELQSRLHLVCRLLLAKKKHKNHAMS